MENKKCAHCKEIKTVNYFYYNKKERRYSSWCISCSTLHKNNRKKDLKKKSIDLFGGKCCICGYNKNYAALDFHHLNPDEKDPNMKNLFSFSWEKIIKELKKCILVCANCHREIHNPQGNEINDKYTNFNKLLNINCLKPTGKCSICNEDTYGTIHCSVRCSGISKRKTKRPSKAKLLKDLLKMPLLQIGKKYGVSDNAIRKWCKSYNLPYKKQDIVILKSKAQ